MSVVVVDWRASRSVSHTTRAWAAVARRAGRRATILTLPGADLVGDDVIGIERPGLGGYALHSDLVRLAADYVRRHPPKVVVLQNYAIPHEERRVAQAARDAGSRVVIVTHADRPGPLTWGSSFGLGKLLACAHVLVAHSRHVADRLTPGPRQRVQVVPLPPPQVRDDGLSLDVAEPSPGRGGRGGPRVALHLRRGPLRADTPLVRRLARAAPDGWQVRSRPLPAGGDTGARADLLGQLAVADALLTPRGQHAQSTSVVLAQSLGTVPIVSDHGALPEQVEHGAAGLVVPAGSGLEGWRAALERLEDPGLAAELARRCRAKSHEDAAAFERIVTDLLR